MALIIPSCHYLLLKTYNALRHTRAVTKTGTLIHLYVSREVEKRRKRSRREEGVGGEEEERKRKRKKRRKRRK